MEIKVELKGYEETFKAKVVGVTKSNPDGSNRQSILQRCRKGEPLDLVREPNNPYDKLAIAVFRANGEQIGYLPQDPRLAVHIDRGGRVSAKIHDIVGGSGFLGLFIKSKRKHYGCIIEINKGGFDWAKVTPFMDKSREIEKLIDSANEQEKKDLDKAIRIYRKAIQNIEELDSISPLAKAWRSARYPINRLSMMLDKSGRFDEALQEIEKYEHYPDSTGLSKVDEEAIQKRKIRLKKKIKDN
jgi:tetratricopeptide (TPR) repeat protein